MVQYRSHCKSEAILICSNFSRAYILTTAANIGFSAMLTEKYILIVLFANQLQSGLTNLGPDSYRESAQQKALTRCAPLKTTMQKIIIKNNWHHEAWRKSEPCWPRR